MEHRKQQHPPAVEWILHNQNLLISRADPQVLSNSGFADPLRNRTLKPTFPPGPRVSSR
jgi:hypothetical protein